MRQLDPECETPARDERMMNLGLISLNREVRIRRGRIGANARWEFAEQAGNAPDSARSSVEADASVAERRRAHNGRDSRSSLPIAGNGCRRPQYVPIWRIGRLRPNRNFGGSDAHRLGTTPDCGLSRWFSGKPGQDERSRAELEQTGVGMMTGRGRGEGMHQLDHTGMKQQRRGRGGRVARGRKDAAQGTMDDARAGRGGRRPIEHEGAQRRVVGLAHRVAHEPRRRRARKGRPDRAQDAGRGNDRAEREGQLRARRQRGSGLIRHPQDRRPRGAREGRHPGLTTACRPTARRARRGS